MPQFKHILFYLLRHPKFCQPFRQRSGANPTANTADQEPNSLRKLAHPSTESETQDVQSSTDTLVEGLELYSDESENDDDAVRKARINVEVQSVHLSTNTTLAKVEEIEEYDGEDDDDDIPEAFPCDLAKKTRIEMMIDRLYVAVVANDREIVALRTCQREKFSHIVRITFDPLTRHGNITPSSGTSEEIHSDDDDEDKPDELRLTCSALTFHYDDGLTALTEKQLVMARNYIAQALPNRNDAWEKERLASPFTPAECEHARVLIVVPTDRSADVMAVLVCYMAFLMGMEADRLLGQLKRLSFVHSHRRGDILGKESLAMAGAASKQKW